MLVYLLIGDDSLAKDLKLKSIKAEFLPKENQDFNFDTLYAKELDLSALQERILAMPLKSSKRIIAVKDAQNLSEEIKEFILNYAKNPHPSIVLVLDIIRNRHKDEFILGISRHAQVSRFKDNIKPDTFSLNRQIDSGKPDYALSVLNQLLKDGEKPERILGGLRYAVERDYGPALNKGRKLKALLNCDIEIKTGKLKPDFALEKLVISLCGFNKPFC